jgi:hydrogenase maturation protease
VILIAGIGNIFLGDDAFGCEVVRRLATRPQSEDVRVRDFGIRGLDLVYALLDEPETVILVDAVPRGQQPGTLYVIEPDLAHLDNPETLLVETHGMDPVKVLRMAQAMGGRFHRVLLVGCEPESFGLEDEGEGRMGLSAPVEAAVDEAIRVIESLVSDICAKHHTRKVEVT